MTGAAALTTSSISTPTPISVKTLGPPSLPDDGFFNVPHYQIRIDIHVKALGTLGLYVGLAASTDTTNADLVHAMSNAWSLDVEAGPDVMLEGETVPREFVSVVPTAEDERGRWIVRVDVESAWEALEASDRLRDDAGTGDVVGVSVFVAFGCVGG